MLLLLLEEVPVLLEVVNYAISRWCPVLLDTTPISGVAGLRATPMPLYRDGTWCGHLFIIGICTSHFPLLLCSSVCLSVSLSLSLSLSVSLVTSPRLSHQQLVELVRSLAGLEDHRGVSADWLWWAPPWQPVWSHCGAIHGDEFIT